MNRRAFLLSASAAAQTAQPFPMGYNTYCLRALRWTDAQHLDFAAAQKLDAIFLQDSLDPKAQDPAHWKEVRERAKELGLHLESGGAGMLPKSLDQFDEAVATLRKNIVRAQALGSPIVRGVIASDRASLPKGVTPEAHLETILKLLKAVRTQLLDAGMKVAIEVHKDFNAWEFRELVTAAAPDATGIYLDTGNPVFMMEDPVTTVEELGRYAVTLHLRDSVVYETKRGIAVQWVPLGEGVIDFPRILERARELCPRVHVFIKPITGRPPVILPIYDTGFWKDYQRTRAQDLARFLKLAREGRPYEGHVVIEDLQNQPVPPHFAEAVKYQQREHMERSIAYGKQKLGLGRRWRSG
ncbi:MAG: sugar phosphate isomerase/epimerase [Bryobacteraceae bacterium]|nr:sugar phosphate isomerase/epimerase [Bryobacteraceae bacterium]